MRATELTAATAAAATAAAAATVDLCDDDALDAECAASEASDASVEVAIVGVQAVLDEQIRAAGNELAGDLDKTIASTQAWRQQQQEQFEAMRSQALAELTASNAEAQLADSDVPLPRCKPRPQRTGALWAPAAAEGDENAAGVRSPRPRPLGRLGPAVSLGEVASDADANTTNATDASSEGAKALAAAVAARTEMLKVWEQEMDDLSRNLNDHLEVLKRVQALDG